MENSLSAFFKRVTFLFLLSTLTQICAYADSVTTGCLDGIYYRLHNFTYGDDYAQVIAPPKDTKYVGDISISSNVRISYSNYEVRGFESGAFIGQDEMVSLRCPMTYMNTVAPSEFEGCSKLENLDLYNANNYSTNISYGGAAYERKQTFSKPYTTYYNLMICPHAIETLNVYNSTYDVTVNSNSFVHNETLKTINLSKTATVTGSWGRFVNFESFDASVSQNYASSDGVLYTKDLERLVAMPGKPRSEYRPLENTTTIANSAFASCNINNLYLDDKTFSIYPFAFSAFSGNLYLCGVSNLTKESNVTYINGARYFTNFCGNLFLKGEVSQQLASYLGDLNESATIYCEGQYIDLIRQYWAGNIVSTTPCWISEREAGYTSVTFSLNSESESILESAKVYFDGTEIIPNDGKYSITGLVPDSTYNFEIHFIDSEGNNIESANSVETLSISGKYTVKILSTTQTTALCELYVPKDILNIGLNGGIYATNPCSDLGSLGEMNEPIITLKALEDGNVYNYNNHDQAIIKCEVSGLTPGFNHDFTPIITNNNNSVRYDRWTNAYPTASLNLSVQYSEQTQRSFKIASINNSGSFNCNNWAIKADNGLELVPVSGYGMNNLFPETEYYVNLLFEKDNVKFKTFVGVKTAPMNFDISITDISSTSAKIEARYNSGNAIDCIKKTEFSVLNNKYEGNTILTGLKPKMSYTVTMVVSMLFENYNKTYTVTKNFTTKDLILTTVAPNCVNSTTANVKAETNISNQETNVGFQWKKYDAPSSLAPNEGYAFVYDGIIEGQIKNLQSTSYYNVRAFYKTADGSYYYGAWITFDPSDFSYFDPTVRSFDNPKIEQNNVTLYGYALGGSDEIVSQGFEYWNNNLIKSRGTDNVITVQADGQIITATLNNLSNGNYTFRAYVETSKGYYYGEEYNFLIEASGIEDVLSDNTENIIIGYYNLNGIKFDIPQKGFNVVVYKDGTSKKVFIR